MRADRLWLAVATLPLLAPLALLPFPMVEQWGCGYAPPPGQAENIERFRSVALPLIGFELAIVVAAIILLTLWSRPGAGSGRFVGLAVAAVVLALVLATPYRGLLAFGGLLAFAVWPITVASAVLLSLFLVAFRGAVSTAAGRLIASLAARAAAWLVGLVLLGLLFVAIEWDGGPFYC
jgi:hypothetical protein